MGGIYDFQITFYTHLQKYLVISRQLAKAMSKSVAADVLLAK